MTSYILGIDPGAHGALCFYPIVKDLDIPRIGHMSKLIIEDMPTHEITRNGKRRTQIDLYTLARIIDAHAEYVIHAYIENPQGMPGMASNATYQLGFNVGVAQMAVAANLIPMTLLAPVKWKRDMGLTKDKDIARLKASQLLPAYAHMWSRVKDDGRAEAALIALYGAKMEHFGN